MTLIQQADTSENADFQRRCRQSVFRAATEIVGEDPATTGFSADKTDKRHSLGVGVLSGSQNLACFYRAVATQVGDVADPSTIVDGDINTAVDAVWDDIAGVKYGE
jgi:hypothetical protein